jgi:hypothetical protein
MKLAVLTLLLVATAAAKAADAAPLTLTGNWAGTWTDSRPAYSKSGGDFSCVAVEKAPYVWTCSFSLGKTRTWVVELKGKPENGKIVFAATTSLGDVQGLYTWKGALTADGFTGEYLGPDEEGTFKMKRSTADAEKKN